MSGTGGLTELLTTATTAEAAALKAFTDWF